MEIDHHHIAINRDAINWAEGGTRYNLKLSLHKILIIYAGKMMTSQWRGLDDTNLGSQGSQRGGAGEHPMSPDEIPQGHTAPSQASPCKNEYLEPGHEETLDRSQAEAILQNKKPSLSN